MKGKNPIYEKLCRVFGNKRQKIIIFTTGSLIIDLSYSMYNALLGIMQKSVWFLTMGIYYAILSIMRMISVRGEYKQDKKHKCRKKFQL